MIRAIKKASKVFSWYTFTRLSTKKKISKKCVSISFSHVFFCLGDVIQQGQVVAVLSAMKMEMAVQSKVAGKVSDNFYRV